MRAKTTPLPYMGISDVTESVPWDLTKMAMGYPLHINGIKKRVRLEIVYKTSFNEVTQKVHTRIMESVRR